MEKRCLSDDHFTKGPELDAIGRSEAGLQSVAMSRSLPPKPKADCGLSPQERNRKGSSKKADAQGIDQFFRGASAAKVGSEPSLPNFCNAAKVRYQVWVKNLQQLLEF